MYVKIWKCKKNSFLFDLENDLVSNFHDHICNHTKILVYQSTTKSEISSFRKSYNFYLLHFFESPIIFTFYIFYDGCIRETHYCINCYHPLNIKQGWNVTSKLALIVHLSGAVSTVHLQTFTRVHLFEMGN